MATRLFTVLYALTDERLTNTAARAKTKEFENDRSTDISAPQGFQSISEVLELFQHYQIEAKKVKDKKKSAMKGKTEQREFSSKSKSSHPKGSVLLEPSQFSFLSLCKQIFYFVAGLFVCLSSFGGNVGAPKPRTKSFVKTLGASIRVDENESSTKKKSWIECTLDIL